MKYSILNLGLLFNYIYTNLILLYNIENTNKNLYKHILFYQIRIL